MVVAEPVAELASLQVAPVAPTEKLEKLLP